MKNNFKNSIIMFIGVFLCLTAFIGCNIDTSTSNNSNNTSDSSNSYVASSKDNSATPVRKLFGPLGIMLAVASVSVDQSTFGSPKTINRNRLIRRKATISFCTLAVLLSPTIFTIVHRIKAAIATAGSLKPVNMEQK